MTEAVTATTPTNIDPRPEAAPARPNGGLNGFAPAQAPFPTIPAPIVAAIAKIKAGIGDKIAKSNENAFDHYKFASVDDIYETIRVAMGKEGLVTLPIELEPTTIRAVEKGGDSSKVQQWGYFRIGFVLSLGEHTFFDPRVCETLFIRIDGPQTFQGAKSYAQKAFHRQLFKIATGDLDLDATESENRDEEKSILKKLKKKPSSDIPKLDLTASAAKMAEILSELSKLKKPIAPVDSEAFASKWAAVLDTLQPTHHNEILAAFKKGSAA